MIGHGSTDTHPTTSLATRGCRSLGHQLRSTMPAAGRRPLQKKSVLLLILLNCSTLVYYIRIELATPGLRVKGPVTGEG